MRVVQGIFLIIFVISTPAIADEASKSAKLIELMRIGGLYGHCEQKHADYQEFVKSVGPEAIKDFKSKFPNMTESTLQALEAAYQNFVESAKPTWTVQEAVEVWKITYDSHVTEEELDKILKFYKSPVGQKNIRASRDAISKLFEFMEEKNQKAKKRAVKAYLEELENISKKANEDKNSYPIEDETQIEKEPIKESIDTDPDRKKRQEAKRLLNTETKTGNVIRKMGAKDKVKIGGLSYWVLEAEWEKNLPTVSYGGKVFAVYHFLIIDVIVKNEEYRSKNIPSFYLIDKNGTEHETLHLAKDISINRLVDDPSDLVDPGTEMYGRVVFDVPKQDGYIFTILGDLHEKEGSVFFEVEAH